jgi:hypothetical protein
MNHKNESKKLKKDKPPPKPSSGPIIKLRILIGRNGPKLILLCDPGFMKSVAEVNSRVVSLDSDLVIFVFLFSKKLIVGLVNMAKYPNFLWS